MAGRLTAAAPEERFAALAAGLRADARVSEGRMFGSPGLKVGGKVFAMLVRQRLVVKLPRERVEELLAARAAEPFDPGHGRRLKEWLVVTAPSSDWHALARQALEYVDPGA